MLVVTIVFSLTTPGLKNEGVSFQLYTLLWVTLVAEYLEIAVIVSKLGMNLLILSMVVPMADSY